MKIYQIIASEAKSFFIIVSFLCALNMSGQEEKAESLGIQGVIDACVAMRDAVVACDTNNIRQSANALKSTGVRYFNSLRCEDDSISSLKGHLVFDEAFADSLAAGKTSVYAHADDMNSITAAHRGRTTGGSYFAKTCFVKAGKSTKYSFLSIGHQEIGVVAEAGGLVTMRIHVTNKEGLDFRKDDTDFVHQGLPQRKTTFELPKKIKNKVEIEIVNCGKKDCSFVVISN